MNWVLMIVKINQEFFDFLFKSDDLLLKEWFQDRWIEFW